MPEDGHMCPYTSVSVHFTFLLILCVFCIMFLMFDGYNVAAVLVADFLSCGDLISVHILLVGLLETP